MQHSLASPNIVREYSFSELLEKTVSEKYFLNPNTTRRIMEYRDKQLIPLEAHTKEAKLPDHISPQKLSREVTTQRKQSGEISLLKVNSVRKSKTSTLTEASRTGFTELTE